MPNTNNNPVSVLWSGVNNTTLNSNTTRVASDAMAINKDAMRGALTVTGTNNGTPASGDTIDLWIAWSSDGTNFDTEEHAQPLIRLDTFPSNDPGENPARKTYDLNVSGKQSFKLLARANQGSSRTVTLAAVYNEHRMS